MGGCSGGEVPPYPSLGPRHLVRIESNAFTNPFQKTKQKRRNSSYETNISNKQKWLTRQLKLKRRRPRAPFQN
jgi:hypothetical protein